MQPFFLFRLLIVVLSVYCAGSVEAAQVENLKLAGYEGAQLQRGLHNHLVLHAKVNGQVASFIVDTGAGLSLLQTNRAKSLGISSGSSKSLAFVKGKAHQTATIEDLRAGDMRLGKVRVALFEARQMRGGASTADGVIGVDLLRRHRAVINCRSKQIFFKTDPLRRVNLVETTRAMGFVRVPIQETAGGYLMVPCNIRGKAGRLLLDTGAFVTILDKEATSQFFSLKGRPSGMTARGFDRRSVPLTMAEIDDLRIGTVRTAAQSVLLMDILGREGRRPPSRMNSGMGSLQASVRVELPKAPFLGLLGNELLDQHWAIIDLDSMSLFLRPGALR